MVLPIDIVGSDPRFTAGDHADHHNETHTLVNAGPFSVTGHSHGSQADGNWPRLFVINGTHTLTQPDTATMNANVTAINDAQNAASAAGGGIVLHPGGRFWINQTIERMEGNRWVGNMGSSSPQRYPAFLYGGSETTGAMFRMVKSGGTFANWEFSDTWYLAIYGNRLVRYLVEFPNDASGAMRPDMSGFYFCHFNGNNQNDSEGAGIYCAAVTNLYMYGNRFDAMAPYTMRFRALSGQAYLMGNQWDQGLTTSDNTNTGGTPRWKAFIRLDLGGDHGPQLVVGGGLMEMNGQPTSDGGHIIELFDEDPGGTNIHRLSGALRDVKAPVGAGVNMPSNAAWLRLNFNRTTWVKQFTFDNIHRGPANTLAGAEIASTANRKNLFSGATVAQGGTPDFLVAAPTSNLGPSEALAVLKQGQFARMI